MFRSVAAVLIGAACLSLSWAFVHGYSDAPNAHSDVKQSALMRAKLASTQRIVDGLVSKDFGDITKGAEEIIKICKAEEWKAHEDEVYSHHRRELMLQAEKMMSAATAENLDGAAYSYIHALTTCISCHDHCRDVLKIAHTDNSTHIIPIPTTDEAVAPRRARQ